MILGLTVFDTSTLFAALTSLHPQHAWAREQKNLAGRVALSTHSLAETYKVLTVHPQAKVPPAAAVATLQTVRETSQMIALTDSDYLAALERCAAHNLPGSVVFDALIAQAALKVKAAQLVTLNPKDFRRLGEDVAALLVSP